MSAKKGPTVVTTTLESMERLRDLNVALAAEVRRLREALLSTALRAGPCWCGSLDNRGHFDHCIDKRAALGLEPTDSSEQRT